MSDRRRADRIVKLPLPATNRSPEEQIDDCFESRETRLRAGKQHHRAIYTELEDDWRLYKRAKAAWVEYSRALANKGFKGSQEKLRLRELLAFLCQISGATLTDRTQALFFAASKVSDANSIAKFIEKHEGIKGCAREWRKLHPKQVRKPKQTVPGEFTAEKARRARRTIRKMPLRAMIRRAPGPEKIFVLVGERSNKGNLLVKGTLKENRRLIRLVLAQVAAGACYK